MRCWLVTKPIEPEVLKAIKNGSILFKAKARHQGQALFLPGQDASYSWFELAIIPANREVGLYHVLHRMSG